MRQTGGPARSREGYHWFRGWRKPTAAQRRVLDELVAGGTYAQIASRLGISEDGVKWHLSELREETGLADRSELAEWWEEERNRPAVNLLLPFAALWRFASQNAVATVVAAGIVAVSLAIGWLAYDGLRGDEDTTVTGAAPVQTPERAAAVPFVPTPTPTPAPTGALLFDVETGEATILPGDFTARKWLDTEAKTFTILSGKPSVIDADGNVTQISEHSGARVEPDTDNHRVVIWDWEPGLLEVVDTNTGAVAERGDFGVVPVGARSWAVSPAAGKVAITDEPYEAVTVYDLDASNPSQVFTAESGEYVRGIDWSRDGEWLLVRARTEDDEDNVEERGLIFRPDGTLVMEFAGYASWAGARSLRLYKREDGTRLVLDSIVDLTHQGQIPIPEGELLCVSPDGRYAVTGEPESSAFNAPTEHRLVDLVTGDVVSSVVMNRFLVNCDWTPDGSKAILSGGGK